MMSNGKSSLVAGTAFSFGEDQGSVIGGMVFAKLFSVLHVDQANSQIGAADRDPRHIRSATALPRWAFIMYIYFRSHIVSLLSFRTSLSFTSSLLPLIATSRSFSSYAPFQFGLSCSQSNSGNSGESTQKGSSRTST